MHILAWRLFRRSCICVCLINANIRIAIETATMISVCPKCGVFKKSGVSSCCGRGGSWFGNCGSTGDLTQEHTWSEGIQVCEVWARSKIPVDQHLNVAQQFDLPTKSPTPGSIFTPRAIFTSVNASISSLVYTTKTNVTTRMPATTPAHATIVMTTVATTGTLVEEAVTLVTGWFSQRVRTMRAQYFCTHFLMH